MFVFNDQQHNKKTTSLKGCRDVIQLLEVRGQMPVWARLEFHGSGENVPITDATGRKALQPQSCLREEGGVSPKKLPQVPGGEAGPGRTGRDKGPECSRGGRPRQCIPPGHSKQAAGSPKHMGMKPGHLMGNEQWRDVHFHLQGQCWTGASQQFRD